MLATVLLAAACLDVSRAADTAYAVLIGDSSWTCAEPRDLEAARAARGSSGDLIWFRIDGASYTLREDADLDDMATLLAPLAALETKCVALDEKLTEYDADLSRLDSERIRLEEDVRRYAPGSEKNRVVSAEWDAVEQRRRALSDRRAEIAPERERATAELSRAFEDARRRLALLVDRSLRYGTARLSD